MRPRNVYRSGGSPKPEGMKVNPSWQRSVPELGNFSRDKLMGKSYSSEILLLSEAYKWALSESIEPFASVVRRLTAHSLIAIGSGGSFTTAFFHAGLHEIITGKISYAISPYKALTKKLTLRNSSISIISAEGKNKDILGCFQYVVNCEPQDLIAFSLKENSPLNQLASNTNFASSISFGMPWEKDGYLATNSLFTSCVLIYRAYQHCFSHILKELPPSLDALIKDCLDWPPQDTNCFLNRLASNKSLPILVLTGLQGQVAGVDIESKIAEAALGTTQVVDFRSFAHGRHLWAYEYRNEAAAIVIWSDDEEALFENFVESLPASVPLLSIRLKGPPYFQQIASLFFVLNFIDQLGKTRHIDPGQPVVQETGRAVYDFDAFSTFENQQKLTNENSAILRKFGGSHVYCAQYTKDYKTAYRDFIHELQEVTFGSVVLDYDATLCTPDNRYKDLEPMVARALINLLEKNVRIGVATGRGKSVPEVLIKAIPAGLQAHLCVGLYNGSVIQKLSDPLVTEEAVGPDFQSFYDHINGDLFFMNIFKRIEPRLTQITLSTRDGIHGELAWRAINDILAQPGYQHLKALRSTHSWDIVKRTTSKLNLVTYLATSGTSSLCIGDKGLWPGNDCELLSTRYALGVDEVSPVAGRGWNIAPQGIKGVGATLYYLNQLKVDNGMFTYFIEK